MATCSLVGLLFGPRTRRTDAIVAATPPPGVTTPLSHSTRRERLEAGGAAAFAAAIWAGLKAGEVGFDLLAVGITAGNQVGDVVASESPDEKDDTTAPESKALQARFTVILAVVFDSEHRVIKYGLQFGEIDPVFPEVFAPFRVVPGDHRQNVYTK